MPEGPEIRRAADALSAAIVGKTLTAAWFAFPALKIYEQPLTGSQVTRIVTRGKALLTYFSNDLVLYSHNQLYGVWRVGLPEMLPETKRDLRVRLTAADTAVSLYSASDIDMLTIDQLATHPFLQRIGPDVLDMTVTADQVQARLLLPRFVVASSAGYCWIRLSWPDWATTSGRRFCGRPSWRPGTAPRTCRQSNWRP